VFCAVAIAFAVCFAMLRQVLGGDSPWLGLLLMFYFMGLAKVGEPLFVLRMPKFLRGVRTWESLGFAYRRLGVQRFGRMLRETPLRFLNASVYRRDRDLQSLYRQAASAEATHFWAAVLFTPYIAFVCVRGHLGAGAFFLLVQVLFNIYPILHLRLLRGRLDTLLRNRPAKRGAGKA
jgi:hypothetical protein